MRGRSVRVVLRDPSLERSRLTAGFRFLLAIPHLIWLAGWFSLVVPVGIANWIATLITGEPSPTLCRFLSAFVRYAAHVTSYLSLAADPFPGFAGRPGSYPIDVEIDPPGRQNRWITGFRLILALPAILLADAMLGFGTSAAGGAGTQAGGLVSTAALLGWFVCIVRGRMPEGLRDMVVYSVGYSAQVSGYVFLLTGRYPNSDPAEYESANVIRADPIRLNVQDDLRRSRLTVFFRLLLAVPHFFWVLLWGLAMVFAWIANWFITLIRGRSPDGMHRFLASYLRYSTHVLAYVTLVANPFPGFTGAPGSYPIEVEIDPPEQQNRLITGFRVFLAIPAFLIASALGGLLGLVAIYGWFYALFTGRMPRGLRNLGAWALRYNAQTNGYLVLLTDRYPYSGPSAGWQLTLASAAGAPAPEQT